MKPIFRRILILLCLASLLGTMAVSAVEETGQDLMLMETILESFDNGRTVDLSCYNITAEKLREVYHHLDTYGFLPWNAYSYRYEYTIATGYVTSFTPVYRDENEYDTAQYEQKVAEIIHDVIDPSMSDWQKALVIHDYLAVNCAYDESLTYYRGYDLLVRGTAVCQGYAEAYMDIMNRLGIHCIMVVSRDMEHGWNMIEIGGNWYHVDVTWDDPTPDVPGRVSHKYFLVTDEEMNQDHKERLKNGDTGHYNWDIEIPCTDTSLTDAFWKDVDDAIFYSGYETSYLRRWKDWNATIRTRNELTGKETVLKKDKKEYITLDGKKKFAYYHLGLSLWQDRLYYSSTDTVYSMNLKGEDVQKVYTHKTKKTGTYIYSSYVHNDILYLTLSDHDGNRTLQQYALPATGYHVHSYTAEIWPATCTERGWEFYTCECGVWAQAMGDAPTGHDYMDATCTHPKTCRYCGATEGNVISHDYRYETITEPTMRSKGLGKKICRHCGDYEYYDIPKLTFDEWLDRVF